MVPSTLQQQPRLRFSAYNKYRPINIICSSSSSSSIMSMMCGGHPHPHPQRIGIVGAGFAGLSVAWHLLNLCAKDSPLVIDIYDEAGIGGGASGVAGGLLHPYSPKAKVLWKGAECWEDALKLLTVTEAISTSFNLESGPNRVIFDGPIILRRGILRVATKQKSLDAMIENSSSCLESCPLEILTKEASNKLVPDLKMPFSNSIYLPKALSIHPMRYLQALFFSCQKSAEDLDASGRSVKKVTLHRKTINELQELSVTHDAVILCVGAKAVTLKELSGKLPLRTCRGIVSSMELPDEFAAYREDGPSVLSDAWLAVQGPRRLVLGSTWDWNSRDFSPSVSKEEASSATRELMRKASDIYPEIRNWVFTAAKGGVRAMPPLTDLGSLPLLGCIDNIVGNSNGCSHWFMSGLGARGLLYHGWLGKLMANAVLSCNEDLLPTELTAWRK